MEKLSFKRKEYVFDGKLIPHSVGNKAVWEFTGDVNNVELPLLTSCGCTSPTIKDGEITALYKARADKGAFSQVVTVFYKDGKSRKIIDSSGKKVWNPEKEKDILKLSGEV